MIILSVVIGACSGPFFKFTLSHVATQEHCQLSWFKTVLIFDCYKPLAEIFLRFIMLGSEGDL